ncbi:MAG: helix-turn-helix domain-containing protein [Ilumatobacteraceae bacterium]
MNEPVTIAASRSRPAADAVERTLAQVGDRWTFLILREAFFGTKRFDVLRVNTGASPAVLTDRLNRLLENEIFTRATYGAHPNRFEYHLTPKGLDLYSVIVLMMQWGDTWIPVDEPGIELDHLCSRTGPFVLRCPDCGEPIDAHSTSWRPAQT